MSGRGAPPPDETRAALADAARRAGEAVAEYTRRQREREPPEHVYRYVVEFDATPSTFRRIADHIRTLPAVRRGARRYPLGAGGGKGKEGKGDGG